MCCAVLCCCIAPMRCIAASSFPRPRNHIRRAVVPFAFAFRLPLSRSLLPAVQHARRSLFILFAPVAVFFFALLLSLFLPPLLYSLAPHLYSKLFLRRLSMPLTGSPLAQFDTSSSFLHRYLRFACSFMLISCPRLIRLAEDAFGIMFKKVFETFCLFGSETTCVRCETM